MENQNVQAAPAANPTKKNVLIGATKALSIVGVVFFGLWHILTAIFREIADKKEEIQEHIYGKAGDIITKVVAGVMMAIAVAIIALLIVELVKTIKAKKNLTHTIGWSAFFGAIIVVLLVGAILTIVRMTGKSWGYKDWDYKAEKAFLAVSLMGCMFLIALVASLVRKAKPDCLYSVLNKTVVVLSFVALWFVLSSSIHTGTVFDGKISKEYVLEIGLCNFYIFEILAGAVMMALAGQLTLFILHNAKNIKANLPELIVISIAFVLVLVFFAVFASRMGGDNFKHWLDKTDAWKENIAFASVTEAFMLMGAIANIQFNKKAK